MSEQDLVLSLLKARISFPWRAAKKIRCATELKVTHNRVDIVFFEETQDQDVGSIIAVEAKLKDWRRAIQQAYRDKLFADRVYVALPERYATSAIQNLSEFRHASVGLIVLSENGAKIYHNPPLNKQVSASHSHVVRSSLKSFITEDRETRGQTMAQGAVYPMVLAA